MRKGLLNVFFNSREKDEMGKVDIRKYHSIDVCNARAETNFGKGDVRKFSVSFSMLGRRIQFRRDI
jgi:hypothetical protein